MPIRNAARAETPIPDFYDPASAASWTYSPNQQALFERAHDYRREHGIPAAADDAARVHLLLVDEQKDFCFPQGALYVGGRSGQGAVKDSDRLARFVYRNLAAITEITCTMDSHQPFQIFFVSFWVDAEGEPLQAYREITVDQIRRGEVRPNPAIAPFVSADGYEWLRRQVEFYCAELERVGKYRLYLWPPHCIVGSDGHALAGVVHEARMFHAYVRHAANGVEIKGGNPLTENYSVLAPEVLRRFDGETLAERNQNFVGRLVESDLVIVAGQASSHCVKSSVEDLLAEIRAVAPSLARRVVLLEDCMSAVAVPDPSRPGEFLADYTAEAALALDRFAAAGVKIGRSTDSVLDWLDGG
ncbi:MAG: nicotinamidase [Gemmatimonadetes bacterium]|nr:nicotinamidase [Gemmatimonadota bacterium]